MISSNSVVMLDNFASVAECAELTQWTLKHHESEHFKPACGRISTRYSTVGVPFPVVAYDIQRRIIDLLRLQDATKAPFCDGIYSGFSRNQGEIFYPAHKDPVYVEGTYTLHCNIVTTDSDGGAVSIENHGSYEMIKGRLVAYPVSELLHEVSPGTTDCIRNLWVFGFCVPRKDSTC